MKTLYRIIILGVGSLLIGICFNQFRSDGIKWQILLISIFNNSESKDITYISADSVFVLLHNNDSIFIDTRPSDDFEIDRIPKAVSFPFLKFLKNPSIFREWNKEKNYVLYCFERDCKESRIIAHQLTKNGFKNVMVLYGGFSEWLWKSFPIEKGGNL